MWPAAALRATMVAMDAMDAMDAAGDEFAILAQEAAARGLSDRMPPVRRIAWGASGLPVDEGDSGGRAGSVVSGLLWGEAPRHVVLLHGVALNAHTWDATLLHWGVPALALDLPGHGDSSWVEERPISPARLAQRIVPALDRALAAGELEAPLILVGQSLGGLAAAELAAARASRPGGSDIGQVVLVDILPEDAAPDPSNPAAAAIAAFLSGPAEFPSREVLVQAALAAGLGGDDPEGVRRAVSLNTRVLPDGRVEWKHQIARLGPGDLEMGDGAAQWEALGALAGPVGLVAGTRGVVAESQVARLRRIRPDARVARLESGHNIQEDAPESLARVLEDLVGPSAQA